MNVQSALNAYKETDLSEVESATPHRLIELTFQDLKRNLLIIRRHLNEGKPVGGSEAAKSIAALEILRTSLNFEDGGEIAGNLDQIYAYGLDQLSKIIKDDNNINVNKIGKCNLSYTNEFILRKLSYYFSFIINTTFRTFLIDKKEEGIISKIQDKIPIKFYNNI